MFTFCARDTMVILIPIIIVFIAVGIAAFKADFQRRKSLARFWGRSCTGGEWKQRFPYASTTDIRAFLSLFTDAFAFSCKRRLCFGPQDKVMDVYESLYPPGWRFGDALELEHLAREMEAQYGIDLIPHLNHSLTIGELFNLSMKHRIG